MKHVLHLRLQKIESFFSQLQATQQLLMNHNLEAFDQASVLTEAIATHFNDLGQINLAMKVRNIAAQNTLIIKGFEPQTSLKIPIPRREQQFAFESQILINLSEVLDQDFTAIQNNITEASKLIENLVLVALQNKLIKEEIFKDEISQEELEEIWAQLGQIESLALLQKRTYLYVHKLDSLVIFHQTLNKTAS